MRLTRRNKLVILVILFLLGLGIAPGMAQTAKGPRLAVQLDGLLLYRGETEYISDMAFSPFLAFELGIFSRLSLRLGISPPLSQQSGKQAFATNLAVNAWFGRGPDFMETGLGSYYQNTWCNGMPDYRAYTLYLGWRHVARSAVFRLGGRIGLTPQGKLAVGIGIGFGRAIGSGIL
jgi:hypothetical protein